MRSDFRFLRTRNGVTRFAAVTLTANDAEVWSVGIDASMADAVDRHGDPLRDGVLIAAKAHERLGGRRHSVVIEALEETVVDTSPDAVRCAAAMAAWKSFGRDESNAHISYGPNGWEIHFTAD